MWNTTPATARIRRKFLDPEEEPKVKNTDNLCEFWEVGVDPQWNHLCVYTPSAGVKGNCRERRYEEFRKAQQLLHCNPDSMNSGGQYPWKVIAISAISTRSARWENSTWSELGKTSKEKNSAVIFKEKRANWILQSTTRTRRTGSKTWFLE